MDKLLKIMESLRDKSTGCPWDKVQTCQTIAPYTLEEAYEVMDAVLHGTRQELKEELGDLLLQVVFMSRICEEEGAFNFHDVVESLSQKLTFRHPHVFGEVKAASAKDVSAIWEAQKAKEKAKPEGFFASIPASFPPLQKAYKIQKLVAKVGFDWEDSAGVLAKVDEEIAELKVEIAAGDASKTQAEFGDVMFALVNLARHLGLNPEIALAQTNAKFMARFEAVEAELKSQGLSLKKETMPQMEAAWLKIKKQ